MVRIPQRFRVNLASAREWFVFLSFFRRTVGIRLSVRVIRRGRYGMIYRWTTLIDHRSAPSYIVVDAGSCSTGTATNCGSRRAKFAKTKNEIRPNGVRAPMNRRPLLISILFACSRCRRNVSRSVRTMRPPGTESGGKKIKPSRIALGTVRVERTR